MDVQITSVILSKEISLRAVDNASALFADLMRHRVELRGSVSFDGESINSSDARNRLWGDLQPKLEKHLDSKNAGLYSIEAEGIGCLNGITVRNDLNSHYSNGAKGSLTIYFEYLDDYARFLKEKAVMFKLSINTQ